MAQLMECLSGMYDALGLTLSSTQDSTWWSLTVLGLRSGNKITKSLLATQPVPGQHGLHRQMKTIYVFKKEVHVSR